MFVAEINNGTNATTIDFFSCDKLTRAGTKLTSPITKVKTKLSNIRLEKYLLPPNLSNEINIFSFDKVKC